MAHKVTTGPVRTNRHQGTSCVNYEESIIVKKGEVSAHSKGQCQHSNYHEPQLSINSTFSCDWKYRYEKPQEIRRRFM
jgi:hypothetical protein